MDENIIEGKRILIAEDNELNKFIIINYIEKWKGLPDYAKNGKEAISLLEKNNYDLILMDLEMPVMGGIEASKIIRSMEGEKSQTPIIALSASDMDEIHKIISEAGINDMVPKPFRKERLQKVITTILSKK